METMALPFLEDKQAKSWAYYLDTPELAGASCTSQLDALPWEDVLSQGGNLTRQSLWCTTGNCICPYQYGKKRHVFQPLPMAPWLQVLAADIEKLLGLNTGILNCANLNRYSQPKHDLYWHSDNEKLFRASEFDRDTLIVSISFGQSRTFAIRRKQTTEESEVWEVLLKNGDIFIMGGHMQDKYEHVVKPMSTAQMASPTAAASIRYNITFRALRKHCPDCTTQN
jgi:alkylated DNA repair dioxygenase AlkB